MKLFGSRASDILWLRYEAPKDGGAPSAPQQGDAPEEPAAEPSKPLTPAEKMLPQSEVNRLVQDRLKEQEERLKSKKLKEDKAFEALSQQQEGQIVNLTTQLETVTATVTSLQTELEEYKALVGDMVKTKRKGIPEPFASLLEKYSPLEIAKWLAANEGKLTPAAQNSGGPPPLPKPNGQAGTSIVDKYIQSRNKQPEEKK